VDAGKSVLGGSQQHCLMFDDVWWCFYAWFHQLNSLILGVNHCKSTFCWFWRQIWQCVKTLYPWWTSK
jgi:hypothetical protein